MRNTDIAIFQKNLFSMLAQTIKHNEPLHVSTSEGNAVVLSEEDYSGLIATLELLSIPGMEEKILEGRATPLEECVPSSEVEW